MNLAAHASQTDFTTTRYQSTRGETATLEFAEAVLAGLATDGGLYVPEKLPVFTPMQLVAMQGMDYPSLFEAVLGTATAGLRGTEIYNGFTHPAIAPLKQLGGQDWLLELFHGPTLAFKDFALQYLGRLIEHFTTAQGAARSGGGSEAVGVKTPITTIIGATSGDTGSAAIAGCRGRRNMRIVILHPYERTSAVQRRQMTTVRDENVLNLAIQGSFDDCQNIVKALFVDEAFRQSQQLTAVNSINWARILAQIVYYFYAALRLGAPARTLHFCVPTGNFGDIYAGYLAKQMGLPIGKLIIASNRNDILTRCVGTGEYQNHGVEPSLSPSMDIQISSNFERLLFGYYQQDAAAVRQLMQDMKESGGFRLRNDVWQRLQSDFMAYRVSDEVTLETIRETHQQTGELLDPHTAVGVHAAKQFRLATGDDTTPVVTLATAHPAKFPDAVRQATGITPALPLSMADLFEREERFTILPANIEAVKTAIR